MSAQTSMVQGTTPDAGKSMLVMALCRWLADCVEQYFDIALLNRLFRLDAQSA